MCSVWQIHSNSSDSRLCKKKGLRKCHSKSILVRVAFNNAMTFPWCWSWRRFLRAAHEVKSATRNVADTCSWKQRFCCYSRAAFWSWWCRRSHLDYGWTAALSAQDVGDGPLVLKWCCFIAVEALPAVVTTQLANVEFKTVCVEQTWNARLVNRVVGDFMRTSQIRNFGHLAQQFSKFVLPKQIFHVPHGVVQQALCFYCKKEWRF